MARRPLLILTELYIRPCVSLSVVEQLTRVPAKVMMFMLQQSASARVGWVVVCIEHRVPKPYQRAIDVSVQQTRVTGPHLSSAGSCTVRAEHRIRNQRTVYKLAVWFYIGTGFTRVICPDMTALCSDLAAGGETRRSAVPTTVQTVCTNPIIGKVTVVYAPVTEVVIAACTIIRVFAVKTTATVLT